MTEDTKNGQKFAMQFQKDIAKEKADMISSETHDKYEWLIKPCMYYKESFKDCNSFYAQFNARYTNGRKEDCSQWSIDYKNCCEYIKTGSREARADLIESEKFRRLERLVTMANNNVWEYRDKPPADWHAPLSEELYSSEDKEYIRSQINKSSIHKCSVM